MFLPELKDLYYDPDNMSPVHSVEAKIAFAWMLYRYPPNDLVILVSTNVMSILYKETFSATRYYSGMATASGHATLSWQTHGGSIIVRVVPNTNNLLYVMPKNAATYLIDNKHFGGDYLEKYKKYNLDKEFEQAIFGESECLLPSATSCEGAMKRAGSLREMVTSVYVKLANTVFTSLQLVGEKLSSTLSILLRLK